MNNFEVVRLWLGKYASRLLTAGIVLIWLLVLAHKVVPDYIPHALALTLGEAIIVSMFLFTIERLIELEAKIEHIGSGAKAGILLGSERSDGNKQFMQLLGSFPEQSLDLLQFSGFAATDLMREVVQTYHGTTIRLLIASEAIASGYDGPLFHESNVKATYQNLRVIHSEQPNATFAVWRYAVHPAISGAVIASRVALASWYRIYPVTGHQLPVLRGHKEPTVTATETAAPELVKMVRDQFDSILHHTTTELIVAFGPKAAEVVNQWLSVVTRDLPAHQKQKLLEAERQKIKAIAEAGDFLQW